MFSTACSRDAAARPARSLGVNAALVQRYLIHGKAGVQPQHIKAKQDLGWVMDVQDRRPMCTPGVFMFFVMRRDHVWGQRGGAGRCSVVACFIPCHVSSLTLDAKSQANVVL